MKIGYARVSTEEQHLDLQLDALKLANCDTICSDHGVSGTKFDRPGLAQVLRVAQSGDTIVVWRLDRLGRSLSRLVEMIGDLGKRGIQFVSLTENIDTRSSSGMFMFHMMAALAEFERSLVSERTLAGMKEARRRGSAIGRPRAISAEQLRVAKVMLSNESLENVALGLKVNKRTLARYLAAQPTVADQNADGGASLPSLSCTRAFHRFDWLPGFINPTRRRCGCPACINLTTADSVRRSPRKSDALRVGRQSRYSEL